MSTAFLRSPTGESRPISFGPVRDADARKEYNINEYAN